MYQFQKGIVLLSLSLMGLYKMLNEMYGLEYILTRKLNHDCLQNLFGYIRQMQGTYDHPNTINFKYCLRSLLVGKEAKLISKFTNCTEDGSNGFTALGVFASNVKV